MPIFIAILFYFAIPLTIAHEKRNQNCNQRSEIENLNAIGVIDFYYAIEISVETSILNRSSYGYLQILYILLILQRFQEKVA